MKIQKTAGVSERIVMCSDIVFLPLKNPSWEKKIWSDDLSAIFVELAHSFFTIGKFMYLATCSFYILHFTVYKNK